MAYSTVKLSDWDDVAKRLRKIKTLTKRHKLKVSVVEVDEIFDRYVEIKDRQTGKRTRIGGEKYLLRWTYSLT